MEKSQIFKCVDSNLVVEVVGGDDKCAAISCCGKEMKLMVANTVDASKEKHVPVLEAAGAGVKVRVGSVAHPMTPEHYIEWIEVVNGPYVNRKYLKPGEAPEAEFYVPMKETLEVRIYCNLHGLWKR